MMSLIAVNGLWKCQSIVLLFVPDKCSSAFKNRFRNLSLFLQFESGMVFKFIFLGVQ